jgi:hypothetical protein
MAVKKISLFACISQSTFVNTFNRSTTDDDIIMMSAIAIVILMTTVPIQGQQGPAAQLVAQAQSECALSALFGPSSDIEVVDPFSHYLPIAQKMIIDSFEITKDRIKRWIASL